MTTIVVRLPEPMNAWVQRRVESGLYEDVSDYVRDLIRRDQGRRGLDMGSVDVQALIAEGLADLKAGRVFDEMEAAISEIGRRKSA
jgi:antitoxin ParD1/3/4